MYLALLGMLWFCPSLKGQENSFTINSIEMKAEPGWEVENGKNLTLNCLFDISATSKLQSPHQVLFYKDDILIKNITSWNKKESFFIQAARLYDRGNYKCTVILNNKEKTTKDYSVSVKGVPSPRITVDKIEVMEGGVVKVGCSVPEEKPPIYFIIEKLDMHVFKQRKEKMKLHENFVTLDFPIEERDHVLVFQCQAKISFGSFLEASEFSRSDWVTVREPFSIPKFKITPEGEITEGDSLKLECTILVAPMFLEEPEIIIQKGREILASAKHGTEVSYTPPLAKVEHIGNYTCKVESGKISKVNSVFINITAKQMPVEMSRPEPPLNSNTEKMQSDVEANSHSGYSDDIGNHTVKPTNEHKEPDHLKMDVEYTEVEVLTPDLPRAPERKGTDTVYSEIRKADSGENRHSRIEGSLDAT
ncbi:platelet endothelial cell adhesion molecule [Gracilinanus agilis]|uniref:platelet endothelial cell adhesion molecule n=1 Tax=Gracilinanus agilis TaxID=191870 RepID=UPI001CFE4B53|nr:platelet endothelial cell adhesion molecule [Gracilinanus agilis]